MAATLSQKHLDHLKEAATALRMLSVDMVEAANSGHPGAPLGMADVLAVLGIHHLNVLPQDPIWPNRDRLVLSNGHASAGLYAMNHLLGYEALSLEELKAFRQWGSLTPGHPERHLDCGVETTTGPLGQGIANAVGFAIAQEKMAATFGTDLFNNKTYVFMGDGCLAEGISHEALSLAGHLRLKNLIVLFDDNGITIDGGTELYTSEDTTARLESYGWQVLSIDGHNHQAIHDALEMAKATDHPTFIRCRTKIGYGAAAVEGTSKAHGAPLGPEKAAELRKALAWPHKPFEVPLEIYALWQDPHRARLTCLVTAWESALDDLESPKKEILTAALSGEWTPDQEAALKTAKEKAAEVSKPLATRQASGLVLEQLAPHFPLLIGGSADLTGSNNTKTPDMKVMGVGDFSGTYINYGIREHAMGAILSGLVGYGGLRAYGGTFLIFSDYMRPAIRLAALMELPVIFVMTHDSIGLGEDGPTHQPVEHLASLRAIPGLNVYRPADAVETAAVWEAALRDQTGPSLISLTRQGVPPLPHKSSASDMNQGVEIVYDSEEAAQVVLLSTGSEVHVSLEAAKLLEKEHKISARVISMPCQDLFLAQSLEWQDEFMGPGLRVSVEAGSPMGWSTLTGRDGLNICIKGFGASAPGAVNMEKYGFSPAAICRKVMDKLTRKQEI